MSNTLRLFCLVRGEAARRAFPVKIASSDTVGELKKLIKEENPKALGDFDAKDLKLWQVSIPDGDDAALRAFAGVEEDELRATCDIGTRPRPKSTFTSLWSARPPPVSIVPPRRSPSHSRAFSHL